MTRIKRVKKFGTIPLFFLAAVAMANPQLVSRTTAYGPFSITPAIAHAQQVILQTAGQTTFLIWSEQTAHGARIHVGPLTTAGVVDTSRIIELPIYGTNAFAPAAASSGDEILVVWFDQMQSMPTLPRDFVYFGARIGSDGTLLDPQPVVVSSSPALVPPHVAWNGSEFLVTVPFNVVAVTHGGVASATYALTTPGAPTTADTIDIGSSDDHALLIAQGVFTPRYCIGSRCFSAAGPSVESFLFDPNSSGSPVSVPLPASSAFPLAIGPARGGFVVAWNFGFDVDVMHVALADGSFVTSGQTSIATLPGTTVVPSIRAANDLVVFQVFYGVSNIFSTMGRLSLDGENGSSPDVLWLGGDRYLVAYIASDGGRANIVLLTIGLTGRGRVAR